MNKLVRMLKSAKLIRNHDEPKWPARCGEREAIYAAARETRVSRDEMENVICSYDGAFYEVKFNTAWMMYDCYISAFTGELCGIDCIPMNP